MDRAQAFPAPSVMGLFIGIFLAALTWLAVRRTRGLTRAPSQLLAAALLVGLAGYTLQGRSGLMGSPAAERVRSALPDVLPTELAAEVYGRFNGATPWIIIANGYMGRGDSANALATLTSALKAAPRNSELWIALGNAMIIHNAGRMSPAAELAFSRSLDLAPTHPGPRYLYGLALLQQGQVGPALALWNDVLRTTPEGPSWRPALVERVRIVERLSAR